MTWFGVHHTLQITSPVAKPRPNSTTLRITFPTSELELGAAPAPACEPWQWDRTDWKTFRETLRTFGWNPSPLLDTDDFDDATRHIVNAIAMAAEKATPRARITAWSRPGYTEEMAALCTEAKHAH